MKLSNQLYDILVTIGTIVGPAVAAFYETLANIWGLPYSDKIPPTIMALVVLLNSCLGISSKNYYRKLADNLLNAEGVDPEDVEHHEEEINDSVE